MTLVDLVTLIGDILTKIDAVLSSPDLPMSDPNWQQLYALRKHLDDQQRELVTLSINLEDAAYGAVTAQLAAANKQIQATINDLTKIASTIKTIAQVASGIDAILALAAKM